VTLGDYVYLFFMTHVLAIYIGYIVNKISSRSKRTTELRQAYQRGWKAGQEFLDRIIQEKTERESGMKIVKGGGGGSTGASGSFGHLGP
jgi:hypothetical protein